MTCLPRLLFAALLLLAGLAVAPGRAHAAQSYDSCTGFIDSLPATITTQGVWCLRDNLTTAITTGDAITIDGNNVTIDCNDFKIGGLAAGDASLAFAIRSSNRQNTTVRHCNIRGFLYGLYLSGAGHLVEDNRFDNNLYVGVHVSGDNNVVRRNRVYDTGGTTIFTTAYPYGIFGQAQLIDNTVAGVFGAATSTYTTGIFLAGEGNVARGNRVSGLQPSGEGMATGIGTDSPGTTIDGNQVTTASGTSGTGVKGESAVTTRCSDNFIFGFSNPLLECADAGGNTTL